MALAAPRLVLHTERLYLAPCSPAILAVVRDDLPTLGARLGVRIPDGWPSPELRGALDAYIAQLGRDPAGAAWGLWLGVERTERTLVGDVGFKGRPDAFGRVEIGYGVAPAFRRRGYAREAAAALVRWALSDPDVKRITAECAVDNLASIGVLEALGMRRSLPEGRMLRWSLTSPT